MSQSAWIKQRGGRCVVMIRVGQFIPPTIDFLLYSHSHFYVQIRAKENTIRENKLDSLQGRISTILLKHFKNKS
jgi:hypothetical protein